MRFRNISIILGCLASIFLILVSDPTINLGFGVTHGAQLVLAIKTIITLSLAALVIHLGRKTLFDYLDISLYLDKAKETAQGAGLAVIGVGLVLIAFAIVFVSLVFLL